MHRALSLLLVLVAAGCAPPARPDDSSPVDAPAATVAAPRQTESVAGTWHIVERGESLARIARRLYGDDARWRDVLAANPGLKPEALEVGQRIYIPALPESAGGDFRR